MVGGSRPTIIPSIGAIDYKYYRYAGVLVYVYGYSPFSS
jgi:hypothetical protein